jgi:hypothetical protein
MYRDPGIFFDDHPNAGFTVSQKIPPLVRVIAVEKDKFKSKVKNFKSYEGKVCILFTITCSVSVTNCSLQCCRKYGSY